MEPNYTAIKEAILRRLNAQFPNAIFDVTVMSEKKFVFKFIYIEVWNPSLEETLTFNLPVDWPHDRYAIVVAHAAAEAMPINMHKRQILMHELKSEMHRVYPWVELEFETSLAPIGEETFIRVKYRPYGCEDSIGVQFLLAASVKEMIQHVIRTFPSTRWYQLPSPELAQVALQSKVKGAYFDQDYEVSVSKSVIGIYFVDIYIGQEQPVKLYFSNDERLEYVIQHTLEVLARYVKQ